MADKNKYVCLDDFENDSREILEASRFSYFSDGCNEQFTLKENREAFKRYRLRPKILRDVSNIDLNTTILGERISWPVCLSPTAFHRMADYNEGEVATARAAASVGSAMALSCVSTRTIEDVAAVTPRGVRWMQVQFYKPRAQLEVLIKRAEKAGFTALLVTVDQPKIGDKYSIMRVKNALQFQLQDHEKPVNLPKDNYTNGNEIISKFDDSATWQDVKWLKYFTKLPLVLKGITTGDQAKNAVECGVDGILVSNHGGRQLDYLPATIDALPEVVAAVAGSGVEVYMDGGVRHGTDVFKALARGARAVFIGRPIIWGLTCNGYEGAKQVLDILKDEVEKVMAFMGCRNVNEIEPSMVVHEDYYRKCKL
ncbi:2-Hydroxyacid oxidase 1-like [Antedon mediterranea]|uniref:2-Hydroxyacid oxidase 1-like n=1 Tax=Antedon mediterranea TaxID=105859 RepID=UPI003AF7F174